MDGTFAIETDRLTKVYRSRFRGREITAVSSVDLQVRTGTTFGLLGANGAGKTTFVKLLLSAVHPTSGTARVFGLSASEPEARRPIGYLPENHRFPTYLTGRGMLDFYGALSGMSTGERRKRVPEMIDLVGLTGWEQVRIKKYSKGMLQRLGLAQALMHRPRLLVLDEPTDGVDPAGRKHIRAVLTGLLQTGVSIFINSHLLTEVESFCDEVAILNKGEILLQGKVRDLIAGRGYSIVARGVGLELEHLLDPLCANLEINNGVLRAEIPTLEDVNRAIDEIRYSGALIESVHASTTTLEQVFLKTTGAATPVERMTGMAQ